MFPKIVGLGSLSAIVVYNDATESHDPVLAAPIGGEASDWLRPFLRACILIQPPDWLLLHTSGVPQHLEGQSFQLVPANAANGGTCIVSTYLLSPCQLTNKGFESPLKSRFAELRDHFADRIHDLVKLGFCRFVVLPCGTLNPFNRSLM